MKKLTRFLAATMTVVLLLVMTSGCSSDADRLVGSWTTKKDALGVAYDTTYVFAADGSGTVSAVVESLGASFSYTLDEDMKTLAITTELLGIASTTVYGYAFADNKLTLTSESETLELTRVE